MIKTSQGTKNKKKYLRRFQKINEKLFAFTILVAVGQFAAQLGTRKVHLFSEFFNLSTIWWLSTKTLSVGPLAKNGSNLADNVLKTDIWPGALHPFFFVVPAVSATRGPPLFGPDQVRSRKFAHTIHNGHLRRGRRKVGMGRSVKDKFKSCLAVSSSRRRSFFHYSRCQSRGPHEDWDQIWYRLLGLLSEMWYQAWYQMWYRPLGPATRSVVRSGTKSGGGAGSELALRSILHVGEASYSTAGANVGGCGPGTKNMNRYQLQNLVPDLVPSLAQKGTTSSNQS